ncbi:Patatin [Heracleum sosnowskyi]|uniref:Patatin n=1 Tax=Heracleum sosnowskyi TaxID=360622 RepID=A0AAD8HYI8_9APIA|nr:Patatin [Heracleum sosnowskyi]
MAAPLSMLESNYEADKLTYEIFSILENKFLFGHEDPQQKQNVLHLEHLKSGKHVTGKVRVLSIDGGGATHGLLAAKSLVHLESHLQQKSNNPNARISHYFDVVAGSGAGGVLAALLFTAGKDGGPMFSAKEALKFLTDNRRKISKAAPEGLFRRFYGSSEKVFGKTFGELSLKDTLKAVLVPCYDVKSGGPFVFSRADALEIDGYDFMIKDVCAATSAGKLVDVKSVDRKTKITAFGGEVAMNNPTAAAITHVLNNKQEFPFCNGVEDLLVVSLGNGEAFTAGVDGNATPLPASLVKIAGDGVADMVDQAVSMAFGECGNDYVRIQANGVAGANHGSWKVGKKDLLPRVDEMLRMKSVESVLFKGKKLVDDSNLDKLELFSAKLIKEEERRKTSILPTVVLKQAGSPRTSSATTLSTVSSC